MKTMFEGNFEENGINMDKFKSDFKTLVLKTNLTPKDMLVSLFFAFRMNSNINQNKTKWVEKTTSTEIYSLDISNWIPKSKFIHIIRDPRDNWASLKSGWEIKYKKFNDSIERFLQSMIDRGKLGMELAIHNSNILGKDRYKVVKYEELTTNPVKVMKEICEFLQISYDDILLKPTICGKLWKGNNFEGENFDSISNTNIGKWKERVDEHEAQLIEYHFADVMQHFGYDLEFSISERVNAVKEQYRWANYAQMYSYTSTKSVTSYKNRSD